MPAWAIDVYTFTAQTGGSIRATMGEVSGSGFDPQLNLYGPSGLLLASHYGSSGAAVEAVAPQTGTYYLAASDQDGGGNGTYTLGLIAAPGPVTPGPRGGLIISGEERGDVLPAGALDVYTFTAQAGGGIRATMGEVSGSGFDPQLNLYSPSGLLLASHYGSSGAAIDAVAPETGTYYLAASDQDGGGNGTYTLGLIAAPGSTTSGPRGGSIVSGEPRGGALPAGALDVYTFTAQVGGDITASMTEISGSGFDPRLNLYGPSGLLLASDFGSADAIIQVVAPQTGTYYLAAGDQDGGGNGTYSTSVQFEAVVLNGDMNSDGFVGIEDLNIVLGNWNQAVTPGDLLFRRSHRGRVRGDRGS